MQRFYISPVQNKGRLAFQVNYGEIDTESRRWRRRQNLFWDPGLAEEFLMEKRREFLSRSRVNLGGDRLLHRDVLRAVEVLNDVPGATMEAAARLLKECRSSRERRGGKFEEPKSRQVELSPRAYLGLVHEAREAGLRLSDLVEGIMWKHLEERSRRRAEEQLEQKWKRNGK
jgi:hypothetical protein